MRRLIRPLSRYTACATRRGVSARASARAFSARGSRTNAPAFSPLARTAIPAWPGVAAAFGFAAFGVAAFASCDAAADVDEGDANASPTGSTTTTRKWHFYTGIKKGAMKRSVVFSGNANPSLAADIAKYLGVDVATSNASKFADGEISISLERSVRGQHVYILQSTCPPVNDNLIELCLMVSAARRASPSTFCRTLFQIERTALHSYGQHPHSC